MNIFCAAVRSSSLSWSTNLSWRRKCCESLDRMTGSYLTISDDTLMCSSKEEVVMREEGSDVANKSAVQTVFIIREPEQRSIIGWGLGDSPGPEAGHWPLVSGSPPSQATASSLRTPVTNHQESPPALKCNNWNKWDIPLQWFFWFWWSIGIDFGSSYIFPDEYFPQIAVFFQCQQWDLKSPRFQY